MANIIDFFKSRRLSEYNEGVRILNEIFRKKDKAFIIHYSCEAFDVNHGRTPRITAICTRNLENAQSMSFSIHLQAQFENLDFNNLTMVQYDELEKKMLNEFNDFVSIHSDFKWVHWNMRDSNYGFQAIANRFRILGGNMIEIAEDRKFDFPRILAKIYTLAYEKNRPKGRLLNLADRNNISLLDAMTGKEEATAFENKEYLKLHKSTLRKVDIIESIMERGYNEELKVNVGVIKIYGLSISGISEIIKNNKLLAFLVAVLGYLIGSALEPVVQKLFGTGN